VSDQPGHAPFAAARPYPVRGRGPAEGPEAGEGLVEAPPDTTPAPAAPATSGPDAPEPEMPAPETPAPETPAPDASGPGTVAVAEQRGVGEQRAAALAALAARADAHAAAARSPRTRTAYASDWNHFTRWCALAGRAALPAEVTTVRLYLTDLEAVRTETGAGLHPPAYQPATLARRLAAIAAAHRDAGHPTPSRDPAVAAVLTGIKRTRAHPPRRMRPLLLDDIRTLLAQMDGSQWPGGLAAARDSFVVLGGFAGALRRSELAALTIGDLTWHPDDGIHVRIRTSKTDQDAAGATIVLPYGKNAGTCPPCAALRWLRLLDAAAHGRPALMRAVLATPTWPDQSHLYPHPPLTPAAGDLPASAAEPADPAAGRAGARATDPAVCPGASAETPGAAQSRACRAPVPPLPAEMPLLRAMRRGGTLADTAVTGDALHTMIRRRGSAAGLAGPIGFHSLRAGFVTQARRACADHRAVRRQTRHSSDAMVELYDRDHTPLAGNAVTTLGL